MKLSVLLVTYNQEKYIADALSSILMQKVDFDYEIIIADDFSTDNTRDIANSFIAKYPEKIRILSVDSNVGITKNYQRAFKACKGEYVAVLEGDDLWTSPLKLKKQVELLDSHNECNICFNRFIIKDEELDQIRLFPAIESSLDYNFFTTEQLVQDNFIGNFSACVYRKSIIDSLDVKLYEMRVYDWMFNIVCSQNGLICYLPEVMSLYRYHSKGTWSTKSKHDKSQELLILIGEYDNFLKKKYHTGFLQYKKNIQGSARNAIYMFIPKIIWVLIDLFFPPVLIKIAAYIRRKFKYFNKK